MKKKQSAGEKIIVALDTPDLKRAKRLVKLLRHLIPNFKIGSELYTMHGPDAVKAVRWAGGHVFLDLKYHDIPNTVAGAVRAATLMNVFMISIHAAGGREMMEAARRAMEEGARKRRVRRRPKLVAVTVLTSMSEEILHSEVGIGASLNETVTRFARMAELTGMDGVVASARELPVRRSAFGRDLLVVTPGIRPAWSVQGDQTRIVTPEKALALGADYLVIGRPITQAKDPREAAERLIREVKMTSVYEAA